MRNRISQWRKCRPGPGVLLFVVAGCLTGCAVRHYDEQTGIEHLWGFGHLRTKVGPPNEGTRTVVTGVQTLGLGVGTGQDDRSVTIGWSDTRKIVVADDSAVNLTWPNRSFFKVQAGSPIDSLALQSTNSTR